MPCRLGVWTRLVQRLVGRTKWHWKGLLWWLVRRPELRGLRFPYPATETVSECAAQNGGREISAATLEILIELRNKMGFSEAFLEDEQLSWALSVTAKKTGIMGRVKQRAREEKSTAAASPAAATEPTASHHLLGPRGGLPRSKEALQELARSLSLNEAGKTVDQLKAIIRQRLGSAEGPAGPGLGEDSSSSAGASSSRPVPPARRRPTTLQQRLDGYLEADDDMMQDWESASQI